MVQCEGCNNTFTLAGYTHHLAQSTNPACSRIYNDYLSYQPESDLESDSKDNDSEEDETPIPFQGDYFGSAESYGHADFPMDDANDIDETTAVTGDGSEDDGETMDDNDDEDDGDNSGEEENYEGGWEPMVPQQGSSPMTGAGDHAEVDDMEDEDVGATGHAEREQAESRIGGSPVVIDYPNPRAGERLRQEDSSYTGYEKSVQDSENNIYAPFSSKREWEIARWAKLRGPGSTAFTDLLKIDGVSFRFLRNIPLCTHKMFPRLLRVLGSLLTPHSN